MAYGGRGMWSGIMIVSISSITSPHSPLLLDYLEVLGTSSCPRLIIIINKLHTK